MKRKKQQFTDAVSWVLNQIQRSPGVTSKQLYFRSPAYFPWQDIEQALYSLRDSGQILATNDKWHSRKK